MPQVNKVQINNVQNNNGFRTSDPAIGTSDKTDSAPNPGKHADGKKRE